MKNRGRSKKELMFALAKWICYNERERKINTCVITEDGYGQKLRQVKLEESGIVFIY